MLASDLALALDASLVLRRLGLVPDPWQAALLQCPPRRALLLCTRQAGKSTVAAALAVHEAIYSPGALVLVLSPSLRQSQELFRRVLNFYGRMGQPSPVALTAQQLTLANGSRIIALPGDEETIRGYSGVTLLILDEAARVTDGLYYSVRPMLAVSRGRLLALSTPWGKRGWFYEEWAGSGDWQRLKVTAHDCPRISPAFLEEERASLGEWWFAQEYLCEFRDTTDSFFSHAAIAGVLSNDIEPLFGGAA